MGGRARSYGTPLFWGRAQDCGSPSFCWTKDPGLWEPLFCDFWVWGPVITYGCLDNLSVLLRCCGRSLGAPQTLLLHPQTLLLHPGCGALIACVLQACALLEGVPEAFCWAYSPCSELPQRVWRGACVASAAPAALLLLLCILAVEVGRSLLEAPGLPVWAGVWVLLPAPWLPGVSPPHAPGEACSWHAPAPEAPAWQPSDFPWALLPQGVRLARLASPRED